MCVCVCEGEGLGVWIFMLFNNLFSDQYFLLELNNEGLISF